MLVRH